jgi:hypothetical protein
MNDAQRRARSDYNTEQFAPSAATATSNNRRQTHNACHEDNGINDISPSKKVPSSMEMRGVVIL